MLLVIKIEQRNSSNCYSSVIYLIFMFFVKTNEACILPDGEMYMQHERVDIRYVSKCLCLLAH